MAESDRKLAPYEFWDRIGRPTKIVAPMVDHSDLAYRMLTRKYGADLVYTQMYNANAFCHSRELREVNFTTCEEDRPLFFQLAGHEPEALLQAARYVEDRVDAIDLNLGCPQGIAKRGRYGAFLMDEVDLLVEIVSTLVQGLKIPVTCKIRIYKDFERTLRLCEALVGAGASLLTVHGRTREEKGQFVKETDWKTIRRIKAHFSARAVPVPIVANGGIERLEDVYTCIQETGVDGVMSSEAILENPALFFLGRSSSSAVVPLESSSATTTTTTTTKYSSSSSSPSSSSPLANDALSSPPTMLDLAEEYLENCQPSKYPVWHLKCVRTHLLKMLYRYICVHTELRDMLGKTYDLPGYWSVCQRVRTLVQQQQQQQQQQPPPPPPREQEQEQEHEQQQQQQQQQQRIGDLRGGDAYYQCSWYCRYREGLEVGVDGRERVVKKSMHNPRERQLDLSTSFLNASSSSSTSTADASIRAGAGAGAAETKGDQLPVPALDADAGSEGNNVFDEVDDVLGSLFS